MTDTQRQDQFPETQADPAESQGQAAPASQPSQVPANTTVPTTEFSQVAVQQSSRDRADPPQGASQVPANTAVPTTEFKGQVGEATSVQQASNDRADPAHASQVPANTTVPTTEFTAKANNVPEQVPEPIPMDVDTKQGCESLESRLRVLLNMAGGSEQAMAGPVAQKLNRPSTADFEILLKALVGGDSAEAPTTPQSQAMPPPSSIPEKRKPVDDETTDEAMGNAPHQAARADQQQQQQPGQTGRGLNALETEA